MFRKIFIALIVLTAAIGGVRAQQIAPRIAGLGDNAAYMSLLREDAVLQIREDSIVGAVNNLRHLLRDDDANRKMYSIEILNLENKIFGIRSSKARLIDKINTIEQDWVLANLNTPKSTQSQVENAANGDVPDSLKVRNLIYNRYFKETLSADDYQALKKAQTLEMDAVGYINRYMTNYNAMSELATLYQTAQTEDQAKDIQDKYNALRKMNDVLSDSLSVTWSYIFDNKSYVYGYLLDKSRQDAILSREAESLSAADQQLSRIRGEYASDVIADYFIRKKVVVDYESAVADWLQLNVAKDSLAGVKRQVEAVDFKLPKVDIKERSFIVYEPIEFSTMLKYSSQNPIPECRVYTVGTVYRILLGTFKTKRAVSTFRGAYPLCYTISADGGWSYYAGAYATKAEAVEANNLVKKKGFARPAIVEWADGVYKNISQEIADGHTVLYRVEINGTQTLSDSIKEIIATNAEGCELSRVGQQMFVVGTFDDRVVADKVATAISQADDALQVNVTEVAE